LQPVRQRALFDQGVSGVGIHATQHKGRRPGFYQACATRHLAAERCGQVASSRRERSACAKIHFARSGECPDEIRPALHLHGARTVHDKLSGISDLPGTAVPQNFPAIIAHGKVADDGWHVFLVEELVEFQDALVQTARTRERVRCYADHSQGSRSEFSESAGVALDNDPPEGGVAAEGVYVAQSSRPGWKSASKGSSASTAGSDAVLLAGTGY